MDERFGKSYKLCSQVKIEQLFEQKKTVKKYPLTAHYLLTEDNIEKPFQIVISAPKKIFRKAHERNRIKRLMKETFRKNKLTLETFLNQEQKKVYLFLVYTSNEEFDYKTLMKKTKQLIELLIKQIKENETH